jgi:dTDP-4-dehydrorhamnose 3,5-epimerase
MQKLDKFMSCFGQPIEGVIVQPQKRIVDQRGKIMHMMKSTDPMFKGFGEIYYSACNPGVIKAWHVHSKMYVNNCVIIGTAKLVCFDLREGSSTKGNLMEIYLGPDNYCTVQIPPGIANGYTPVGNEMTMLANCASMPHDPAEISYIDPVSDQIPYSWAIKHG